MIEFYLEQNGFKINTGEIYQCIIDNSDKIPDKLITTFRNQLSEYLIAKDIPEVAFHPTNWGYISDKVKAYSNSLNNSNPLIPDFFVNQVSFDSDTLSDDDKFKTVWKQKKKAPDFSILFGEKPQKPLKEFKTNLKVSDETKKLILDNFSQGLGSRSDKNAPMNINEWRNWCYDIYSYRQNVNIPFAPNEDSFQFFFTWRIVLSNPKYIKRNVVFALLNHFNLKNEWLIDYLTLIEVKYPQIIGLTNWPQISLLIKKELNTLETNQEPKSKEVYVKINKNIIREQYDGLTELTKEETAFVFNLLQKSGLILSNQELTQATFSKLIMGLTGYSGKKVAECLPNESLTKVQKENIKEFFSKINNHINNL